MHWAAVTGSRGDSMPVLHIDWATIQSPEFAEKTVILSFDLAFSFSLVSCIFLLQQKQFSMEWHSGMRRHSFPKMRTFDAIAHKILSRFIFQKICQYRTESASLIVDNSLDDDVGKLTETKESHSKAAVTEIRNNRWKKCAALKESKSDITTQEEFYKFDFQVN